MSRFWHPFSNPAMPEDERVVLVRGRGATVVDDGGREYFDATAGLWHCAVGHGRERGQLTRVLAGGALQFSPPYVAGEEQIARFGRGRRGNAFDAAEPSPPGR